LVVVGVACQFRPGFQEVISGSGSFAIAMPGTPEESSIDARDGFLGFPGTSVGVILRGGAPLLSRVAGFQAIAFRIQGELAASAVPDLFRERAAERSRNLAAKIVEEGESTLGGLSCHRVRLATDSIDFEFRYLRLDDTIFEVGLTSTKGSIRETDRAFFFDSFRQLKRGA
jgi:hypothetical protein